MEHTMHPIIYDVAVSLDGFISGPNGDISKFAHEGPVVDDYVARLSNYATAIMGRATYEFGYQYGLEIGQNPYAHMDTIVFSNSLVCPADSQITVQKSATKQYFSDLKETSTGPIYLCGGGAFAGWLLEQGLIDCLRLKRAPVVLGGGVLLFGSACNTMPLNRIGTHTYENGYVLEKFEM
jgi:dihydrofolate reductase